MFRQLTVLLPLLVLLLFTFVYSVPKTYQAKYRIRRYQVDDTVGNGNQNYGPDGDNFGGATYEDGNCKCVPYYLCENGTVVTNGVGLIDIRVKEDLCADALEVCCKAPIDKKETKYPPKTDRRGCGYRNEQGIGFRITGALNNEAQFGEFPWMIGLLEEQNGLFVYRCGGSLIHPQVVLTAAHCVIAKDPSKVFARAGEWDTQTTNELYPHQQKRVRDIFINQNYNSAALYNDVALLYLEEPFQFEDNVDTICLPFGPNDISLSPNCYASGWGKDKFEKNGIYQVILKKVELPMVDNLECQNRLRQTRLGEYFNLHPSFVCAGGIPERDTCKGDGGSPLVCPIPGQTSRYVQTGIVAWGIGCGTTTPGVYANVALFREWIDSIMQQLNLQLDYSY